MERLIEKVITLAAPREAVWRAITEGLDRWFTDGTEIDLRPGGRATFRWASGEADYGEVLEVDAPRRFAFRWGGDPGPTVVSFALEPGGAGTRVHLTERGWGEGERWDRIFRATEAGWDDVLDNLRSVLDEGRDQRGRAYLGLHLADSPGGVEVVGTAPGSPAAQAGVVVGDRLVEINGRAISDRSAGIAALRRLEPGDAVAVVVERDGAHLTMETRAAPR